MTLRVVLKRRLFKEDVECGWGLRSKIALGTSEACVFLDEWLYYSALCIFL